MVSPHGSDVDGSDEEVEAIDLQGHDSEGDDKDAGGGVVETGYGGAGAGVDADEDHAAGDAPVRQTFVFSATLSVPPSVAARLGRRHHSSRPPSGPLEQLMAKVTFASTPKLVDLRARPACAKKPPRLAGRHTEQLAQDVGTRCHRSPKA